MRKMAQWLRNFGRYDRVALIQSEQHTPRDNLRMFPIKIRQGTNESAFTDDMVRDDHM